MTTVYADPADLFARMLRRCVRTESGCWYFTGSTTSRGYSCVGSGKRSKSILGHQLAVIARDGSIPAGMTVDHQCHDSHTCRLDIECPHRRCVNPAHLVVMTTGDNTARQYESGVCRKGHPLAARNDGRRRCKVCAREYAEEFRASRRERSKRMAAILDRLADTT